MLTNHPPETDPLYLRLQTDYEAALLRAEELAAGAARVPDTIDTDELADRATSFVAQIKQHAKRVDEYRVAEKADFLGACRTVDRFFGALADKLVPAAKGVERKLQAYLASKQAPRVRAALGGTASLVSSWTFRVTDRKQIEWAQLAPYLDDTALEKAIRAAVRAGVRDLRGVEIYQEKKARVA